jgi:hypothetical protein
MRPRCVWSPCWACLLGRPVPWIAQDSRWETHRRHLAEHLVRRLEGRARSRLAGPVVRDLGAREALEARERAAAALRRVAFLERPALGRMRGLTVGVRWVVLMVGQGGSAFPTVHRTRLLYRS